MIGGSNSRRRLGARTNYQQLLGEEHNPEQHNMANIQQILGEAFDSSTVEPQQAFDTLPPGTYTVEISETEVADTKSGEGKILRLVQTVKEPANFAGRKLFKRINIAHTNPQAEQIGRAELSALCRAAGITVLTDSDELIGRVVKAKVVVRPATDKYAEQNEVKAYEAAGASPAPINAAPRAAAKAAPPWKQKAA